MATEERDDEQYPRKATSSSDVYPLDSKCYSNFEEIGRGVTAIVYKALCVPLGDSVVAIKTIDLEKSKVDLENIEREAKMMSLLSHPNILQAHCSFTVKSSLWVVMPFMPGGSLQSIIAACFPDGLSEPCIAAILKDILSALSYLHNQGHLHRDIKAGNILIDNNGTVKLADFGVSASIYDSNLSSSGMLTKLTGTPYWMAPEVIHSHTGGYGFKADIWSFGITALELAHGRAPLSHLPPSQSLMMKFTDKFRFSDHFDKTRGSKSKKFSKAFKEMVGMCLDQDPNKRPTAEKLLKHAFFKNCKGSDFLIKNVLYGVPPVEVRRTCKRSDEEEEKEVEVVKHRRISGWNFNEDVFELDPVFPVEDKDGEGNVSCVAEGSSSGNPGEVVVTPALLQTMLILRESLEDQIQNVDGIIGLVGGKPTGSKEEEMMKEIEKLRMGVENREDKICYLEIELELMKLQASKDD